MHFFYLDESGCNGRDITNDESPIFVLGGIVVRDEGWNKTHEEIEKIISEYFCGEIAQGFELHAHQMLSPSGEGPFAGHDREKRNQLALDLLDLVAERKHKILLLAVDKKALQEVDETGIDDRDHVELKTPYLVCFDNAISMIDWECKTNLGKSARGMVIIDEKDLLKAEIELLTKHRRFNPIASKRVRWIAEFSYPMDSKKNPMVQLSDLICFAAKKFLEIENGYRDKYPKEAKDFYRELYARIEPRLVKKSFIEEDGKNATNYNKFLSNIASRPQRGWKDRIYV